VPLKECNKLKQDHRSLLLKIHKQENTIACPDSKDHRLLLLDPSIVEIPETLRDYEILPHTILLGYDHFSAEEVLKEILPNGTVIPTGFETIGHIAHYNLKPEHMPYRYIIGQVTIDKSPSIKTVVTKLSKIESVFRTFEMEVIGGEDRLDTEVKEGNCIFNFNFRDVYWNSKLAFERIRVVGTLKPNEVVCDMFAGVGPFAIKAAKLGCKVIANDLNPSCYEWLVKNSLRNKVVKNLSAYNMDAREFIVQLLNTPREEAKCEDMLRAPPMQTLPSVFNHIYMNLPMDAIEFLDVFKWRFNPEVWKELPVIHVYGFSSVPNGTELVDRIKAAWGDFDTSHIKLVTVRDVSPRKFMFCVEFRIPEEIAFNPKRAGDEISPDPEKKHKALQEEE